MLALMVALAVLPMLPPARGDEVPRLTFAQLADSMRANLGVTQGIRAYNGREIEIQGDHAQAVIAELTKLGYRVKRAGG